MDETFRSKINKQFLEWLSCTMVLRGLPSVLPEYLTVFPRLTAEIDDRNFEPEKYKPEYDELIKLKLRARNINFKLPDDIRELSWRQRNGLFVHQ
jgi:hypothetical protein